MAKDDKPPPPTEPTPRDTLPRGTGETAADKPNRWKPVPPPPAAEWKTVPRPGEHDEEEEDAEAEEASIPEGGLDKGAVQTSGLDKGAVQAAPGTAATRMGPMGTPMGNYGQQTAPSARMGGGDHVITPDAAAMGISTAPPKVVFGAAVQGEGLVADPDYRISLSDPKVKRQAKVSKQRLEGLLDKLEGLHGEDEEPGPGANSSEVPLTQEELGEIKWAVKAAIDLHNAPSLSPKLINALHNIYKFLQDCLVKLTLLGLSGGSAFKSLEWAVEELKKLLVSMDVPL